MISTPRCNDAQRRIVRQRTAARNGGALIELLIVIATLVVLAALLLPHLLINRVQATRLNCVDQLKELGLDARIWANDHDRSFSWQVSTNDDGSLEFAGSSNVSELFLPMSTHLKGPRILFCPSDSARKAADSMAALKNANISYCIGLDASEENPQMVLFGDRNMECPGRADNQGVVIRPETAVAWGKEMHGRAGNLGLVDGSVQQVTDAGLQKQIKAQASAARFAFP
jgi:competence protein ComGC